MKIISAIPILGVILITTAFASQRDTTLNLYGVSTKIDTSHNGSLGAGIGIDGEALKARLESTSDFTNVAALYKYSPVDKYYIKFGASYINQKVYAPDGTNAKANQYSAALSFGKMLNEHIYAEIGGSKTKLLGKSIGANYEVKKETASLVYTELAARVGDLDLSVNGGKVFYDYKKKDRYSYGFGADYYLGNSKLGYYYNNVKDNITSSYSLEYGYLYINYIDNFSTHTYRANVGFRIAFDDITNLSTYKMPNNKKRALSELHKMEYIVFDSSIKYTTVSTVPVATVPPGNNPPLK